MKKKPLPGFFQRNGLVIVFSFLWIVFLFLQAFTGWKEHLSHLADEGQPPLSFTNYLTSGHFIQATFENWESEFFQMALFVLLTAYLRQLGSSESKPFTKKHPTEEAPSSKKRNAPWPVKKGGFILKLYEHSLSISLFLLFIVSLLLHWYGSWVDFNENQLLEGKALESFTQYFLNNRLWFESFQNWQSEFLSVAAIVFLSVYLREKGSSQSKPVDAAWYESKE